MSYAHWQKAFGQILNHSSFPFEAQSYSSGNPPKNGRQNLSNLEQAWKEGYVEGFAEGYETYYQQFQRAF